MNEIKVGQTWQHKRERHRRVEIFATRAGADYMDGIARFYVRRNTSRRTQAIKESTLRRDYREAT